MSETQKSPKMGLSDDSQSAIGSAKFSGLPAHSLGMEINSAITLSNSDINGSLRSQQEKDFKMYGAPYFLPPGGFLPGAFAPLPNHDIMSQQLLAQMQLLSFVQQNQLLNQKKQLELADEKRAKEIEKIKETQRLSLLKQKPKEQQSAVASNEVIQHLRNSLMNKLKKRNQSHGDICDSVNRSWQQRSQSSTSPPAAISSSLAHIPSAASASLHIGSSMSPPSSSYRSTAASNNLPGPQDVEFPIRKTLSEPNLKVKSAIKQKLGQDRRNSPLINRRRQLNSFPSSSLTENSENGYSHTSSTSPPMNLGSTSAIAEEVRKSATKRSFEEALASRMQMPTNNSLYISMPNISFNRKTTSKLTEADIRASHAIQYGVPLTGHMFQPSMIAEEDYIKGLQSFQQSAINEARRQAHPYLNKAVTTSTAIDPQAMAAPGQRHIRHPKPLSRTQSAPLPIMHPAAAASLLLAPQQQALLEQQELVRQHSDRYLKQQQKNRVIGQLRQTLLQRSSSKNHMEQVDEESEARLIQEMQESREDESQHKAIHSSHGSIYAAMSAASVSEKQEKHAGLDLSKTNAQHKLGARYLARTHSSPLVAFGPQQGSGNAEVDVPMNLASRAVALNPNATGVVYDEAMLRHNCPCRDDAKHLENPSRIQSIWNRLNSSGIADRCVRINAKKASIEQLQLCHTESYSLFFGINSANRKKLGLSLPDVQFQRLNCGGIGVDTDTYWNEDYSHHATRIAVGSVIELASSVYEKQLKNGMAIVRPPGHHSEEGQAMGFCFFNSVAIAAKHLKHKLGANKILILDWDVHHGMFFPGTGSLTDCGEMSGLGFNVNIPFSGGVDPPMGDAEYMAAFRSIVMPIVKEFKPQITLVSAGFDAADGHSAQLGGYKISPAGFGFMTKQLMSVCDNRVVLVLEGGYNLPAICDSSEMCTRALLGENVPLPNQEEILRLPNRYAVQTLEECSRIQAKFWPSVANHRSKIAVSFVDSLRIEKEESETVSAMASLSMVNSNSTVAIAKDVKNAAVVAEKSELVVEPMEES